ncbi:interferon-induced protein with tetratricopeptide repeats 5-like [Poeciliopsis prolifica]|uniref:interferon-induced protein with tetratricopeptide repeats 5-like n=1 Tax=Poeciliopsis prolifica TaxID=188132 RepID=UPI002414224F|nr:interferon-induced protein with tetratricopeptide repeats 5-like [Poeciliopsis prolifica]
MSDSSSSSSSSVLFSMLQQLQSHFTWDLKKEDMELENLSTRLGEHIDLQLGCYCRLNKFALLPHMIKYPNSSSEVFHPEVYGEKGWTYLKLSKSYYLKAIKCFQMALEVQKDDSEWNAGYAIALFRTDRDTPEASEKAMGSTAITQLRRALELSPDDGVLLSMLAVKLGVEKKYEEAESLVEKAMEIAPDNPHAMRYISKYFRAQGNIEQSIELLERALERSNTSAFIYHQLGMCYKRKKINEQKIKHYDKQKVQQLRRQCIHNLEKAVEIKPSFVFARVDLAQMYGEENNLSRAEEMFQLCFKDSSDKNNRQLIHQRYAAFHFYQTKKQDEAITHYTEGLKLARETWEWKECIKKLKKIADSRLSEDEDDCLAYSVLAQVAKAEGDKNKAAELYEKALDCDENNSKYLYALWELRMEQN